MKSIALALAASMLLLTACGRFGNTAQNGSDSTRIVCIAKQYNEIIFALGAQQQLVAVDLSSTYPEEIKKLPTVGYHRALSLEAILAAKPTVVMHDNNIGPEHVVQQLEELRIPMKTFLDSVFTIEQTKALIRQMGDYLKKEKRAGELCAKLDADMQRALTARASLTDTPRVMIIHYGRANNVYLTMTRNSTAARLIEWAGGRLSLDGDKGMVQLSAEAVAKSDPDVILLTDFGYDRLGSTEKIAELPGIAGTRAATAHRIFRIEEHDIVYLGPRTGENVLLFQKLIRRHGAE